MRGRSWLVGMGLCVQAGLASAQNGAPPAPTEEEPSAPPLAPTEEEPSAPPLAPTEEEPSAPPPAPEDGEAIYPLAPRDTPAGYPRPSAARGEDIVTRRYGDDLYVGGERALKIAPERDPYSLSVRQKYPLKMDFQLEVPIPLTDDHDSSDTGFGLAVLFGWDLGFLVPTGSLGWSWAELNLPPGFRDDGRNLKRFHLSFGLIAEFENDSIVTPVIGALLDLNWWHVSGDNAIACGGYYYWGCYVVENYRYTTGFSLKAGLDLRFFRNDRFSLGTGVQPNVTLAGGPFRRTEWWLSPYLLFTVRN